MTVRARVESVEVMTGTRARLVFTTTEARDVDLAPYLHGPVFERIRRDPECFRIVQLDAQLGTIVWPNGADIDPDVLYGNLTPPRRDSTDFRGLSPGACWKDGRGADVSHGGESVDGNQPRCRLRVKTRPPT